MQQTSQEFAYALARSAAILYPQEDLDCIYLSLTGPLNPEIFCRQRVEGRSPKSLASHTMKQAFSISLASRISLIIPFEQPSFPDATYNSGSPTWGRSKSHCCRNHFCHPKPLHHLLRSLSAQSKTGMARSSFLRAPCVLMLCSSFRNTSTCLPTGSTCLPHPPNSSTSFIWISQMSPSAWW